MLRFGLCCLFKNEPIKYRTSQAVHILKMEREAGLQKIADLCLHNAAAIEKTVAFLSKIHIGAFRVNSQILPLKTHPRAGYSISSLPRGKMITRRFKKAGDMAKEKNMRFSFHPDQFVVLNSPREEVRKNSIAELKYQAAVADWIGADVINIHGGGRYGDKKEALARLRKTIDTLPDQVRKKLTLENDDISYTPEDLLPLCKDLELPLVYDIHHHRCLPDSLSEEKATEAALKTWDREPLFHLSSPLYGWQGKNPKPHADYINPEDFPPFWKGLDITIEIEAKAKELAVLALMKQI